MTTRKSNRTTSPTFAIEELYALLLEIDNAVNDGAVLSNLIVLRSVVACLGVPELLALSLKLRITGIVPSLMDELSGTVYVASQSVSPSYGSQCYRNPIK